MLFKILKGSSERISTDVTPFHDGYAYFTPDDGGFYIDSEDNGVQQRIRINPEDAGSVAVSATLLASGWSNGKQTLMISDVKADTNGVISVAQDITEAQMEAAKNAGLNVSAQSAGSLTISASGTVPTINIPVVLILWD